MQFEKCILFIVRMAANFMRLIDIAENLLADTRIQCVFTICDGRSAFGWNLERLIVEKGCIYIPWKQARNLTFDLVITASLHDPLDEMGAPILLLSHGPGHTKAISIPGRLDSHWDSLIKQSDRKKILALVSEEEELLFPDGIATEVIGDCVFDSMHANLHRREAIRNRMNIGSRKLVTLSSTWGPASTYARHPRFATDLIASLPTEEYAVASILHPNIWIGHGSWQIRTWYRAAIDSGLILVPYDMSWQSVLIASDCFIGDHGSVSMYAKMLGIPSRQLAYDHEGQVTELAIVTQASRTIPIDAVDEAIRFVSAPGEIVSVDEAVLRRSFANLDKSAGELKALVYRLIELEPPDDTTDHPIIQLGDAPRYEAPNSYYAVCREESTSHASIRLYPAATGRNARSSDGLLVASTREKNAAILDNCKIVVLSEPSLDYMWRRYCPHALSALLPGEGGAYSLEERDGSHRHAIETDSADPFAICAAAAKALAESCSSLSFTCGSETSRMVIRS